MALADNYEELNSIFTEIKGLDAKSDKSKIEELLEDATEILGDVEINMASIKDPAKKKEAQEKYNMYQRKIKAEKRKTLLGPEKTEGNKGADMSGVAKSRQGLDKLNKAKDLLADTEEVGQKVLSDLAIQKEQIKRSTATMKETNKELSVAQKLANKMSRWWRA
mmetsp:Transcript_30467/g.56915  ORF Transcript_30467/g.56915 Transcript_30467/m.56915 type:complete len:164 (-) Transcript_30467:380-871(-)